MAQQNINIGTSANKGDGDPLRTAFDKINDNFDELYLKVTDLETGTVTTGDITGSVFGADSTLLVDGVNSTISAANLSGALPALDGSALTGITATTLGGQSASYYLDYNNLTNVPTTLDATTLTGNLPALDGSALTDVAAVTSNSTVFTARADVNLLMGEVVYLTGISGNTPTVDKAQANSASTMPAFGIVKADVTASNDVEIVTFGSCPGHDAANFAETGITFALGDTVYVSATEAGKLTNVAPAGETNLIQNIGKIERATPTTNMTIKVGGAGRTNATPALDEGNIFIGNAQNRSSTMSLSTAMSTYGGAFTGDLTGSVFADDSTVLVDSVNGTVNISNQNLDALADISYDPNTLTGPPTVNGQPLVWDTVEQKWYPGYATTVNTITANSDLILNGNGAEIEWVDDTSNGGVQPYFRTRLRFIGTITQNHVISFPNADGTVALTNQLYTDSDVDAHLNQSNPTAGYVLSWNGSDYAWVAQSGGGGGTVDTQGSVFGDDSTLLVDGVNSTINSSALTKPIALADDEKIIFGDDNDLEIHHTGGVNYIAGAGGTILTGNWLYLRKSGTAENYLICKADGAVELYYDNVKKFETTADGVAVTGKITGLTDPTAAQDAATKAYVDANSGGGGGSGLQSRSTATGTTSSLADAAEADLDITGFKSYMLLTVTTDRAARVRLYTTGAARTADASRAEGVDPTSDAGVIAEVITTGAQTVTISPGALGFNLEGTPTTNIPTRVTNKSGGTSTVQVDLNILQLEA